MRRDEGEGGGRESEARLSSNQEDDQCEEDRDEDDVKQVGTNHELLALTL